MIRGYRPTTQYTFIRFRNDEIGAEELEFKFVQMSGSELEDLDNKTDLHDISQPEATKGVALKSVSVELPSLGSMTITMPGSTIQKELIVGNAEFFRDPREIAGSAITDQFPSTVTKEQKRPGPVSGDVVKGQLKRVVNIANLTTTVGKVGAFLHELAGDSDDPKYKVGGKYLFNSFEYITTGSRPTETNEAYKKWLFLVWELEKIEITQVNGLGSGYISPSDQQTTWRISKVRAKSSGPDFNVGETVEIKRGSRATNILTGHTAYTDSNPFVKNHPDGTMRWSGTRLQVLETEFEEFVHGRSQGYRYVVFGDAADYSENTYRTVTRTVSYSVGGVTKTIKLKLKAFSKRLDKDYQLRPSRGWSEQR